MRATNRPMTDGNITRHLIRYAIPSILGDLMQVTYNTVDAIILGRFAGPTALAAVGVANPVMNIAMFFIIGIGLGSSVLMSEFYGAGDLRALRRQFATTLVMGGLFSLAIAMALFWGADGILALCRTPADIAPDTARYLRIVALGMLVTSLYNVLASASRSIGDARTPLICLGAASILNICLDLILVRTLGLGVAGAAYATVIAQAIAALLCARLLYRGGVLYGGRRDFRPDRSLLTRTLRFSYATALQQAGIYVGKLLVQGQVNPLGVAPIAAFNAVNRIDDYALIPQRDLAAGATVLIAQNHGAGNLPRMREGLQKALLLESAYSLLISVVIFFLARPLMRLFVRAEETQVLELGARYLRIMGFFYLMPGITNGLQGYMRAIGRVRLTMIVTYAQMGTRALMTFLLIGRMGLDAVPVACAAGWLLMSVWEIALIQKWKHAGATPGV